MTFDKTEQQILALASVFQASRLIYEIATNGTCDADAFETQINSIYMLDAPDFHAIYGKPTNLKIGLETTVYLFSKKSKDKADTVLSRYVLDVIFLQHRLMKKPEILDFIRQRIKQAVLQKAYFNTINDTIIDNLSDIYTHSISQLPYKIHIIGKLQHLKNPKIFNQIRALLLSGIRASVLWQQLGGKRYHLFFSRDRILKQCKNLLLTI